VFSLFALHSVAAGAFPVFLCLSLRLQARLFDLAQRALLTCLLLQQQAGGFKALFLVAEKPVASGAATEQQRRRHPQYHRTSLHGLCLPSIFSGRGHGAPTSRASVE